MKRLIKIIILTLAVLVLLLAFGCAIYSCAARQRLEDEIREAERLPDSNVIAGTEPLTLPGDSGRACLLVHGWIGSRTDFNDLGERLQREGFTVRLMLLPGHGTTPREMAATKADDLTRAVAAEFDALQAEYDEVAVVGFSMGGALSTLLAAERPVSRLVLVAPYFTVTYRLFYILPAETWNRLLSPLLPWVIKSKNMVRVNKPEARGKIFTYGVVPTHAVSVLCEIGSRAADPGVLGRVTCPVLMLHSRGDEAADPGAAEAAFGRLGSPDREFLWCDESNHHILWDFDAETAARRIVEFLK